MDKKTGRDLSSLFQKEVHPPTPHVMKAAFISFENENHSEVKIECKKPFEAALWLEEILSSNVPPYNRRSLNADMTEPVTFAMDAVYYEEPNNRQRVKAGIVLRFKNMDSDPELHLHGQLTGGGPTAKEVINTLKKAGNSWGDVNFVPGAKSGPSLKIVR